MPKWSYRNRYNIGLSFFFFLKDSYRSDRLYQLSSNNIWIKIFRLVSPLENFGFARLPTLAKASCD